MYMSICIYSYNEEQSTYYKGKGPQLAQGRDHGPECAEPSPSHTMLRESFGVSCNRQDMHDFDNSSCNLHDRTDAGPMRLGTASLGNPVESSPPFAFP